MADQHHRQDPRGERPDRRAENSHALQQMQSDYAALRNSFGALETRVAEMKKELDANSALTRKTAEEIEESSEATKKLETNTHELVETFNTLKGGLTVMGWLGKLGEKLIWLGIPGAFVIYGWNVIKVWIIGGPK